MTPYNVIILTRNNYNLEKCVESIDRYNPGYCGRVIAVDDDETGSVKDACIAREIARIQGTKPFCYSRNVNLAIQETTLDCLILNDDALLENENGFDLLAKAANREKEYGVVSPAIRGVVGCHEQRYAGEMWNGRIRAVRHHTLTFVCVYIRRDVIDRVGMLDERFTCYSHQDDDYCQRVRDAGFKLGTFDGCFVEHGITLKSTFRHHADGSPKHQELEIGARIFKEKHGFLPGEKK